MFFGSSLTNLPPPALLLLTKVCSSGLGFVHPLCLPELGSEENLAATNGFNQLVPCCRCNNNTFYVLKWGKILLVSFTTKTSWVPPDKPVQVTPIHTQRGAQSSCRRMGLITSTHCFLKHCQEHRLPETGRTKKKPCTALKPAESTSILKTWHFFYGL